LRERVRVRGSMNMYYWEMQVTFNKNPLPLIPSPTGGEK